MKMQEILHQVIPLWNGEKPFARSEDKQCREHYLDEPQDGNMRLTDVTEPSITCFPASGPGPHPAVVVCPGGGYGILAWSHEGLDYCSLLNINGFTAFLLKYRCPDRRDAARADAARAMRMIRARAEDFNIDPHKVGMIGSSAGAHLCAVTSAPADPVPYEPQDEIDAQPYRPDFTALIYPAYLFADKETLTPAKEFRIGPDVPPTFIIQAQNDGIQVENAITWFMALRRAQVPCEMHIWAEGGHGYGLARTGRPVADWHIPAAAWFRRQAGIL